MSQTIVLNYVLLIDMFFWIIINKNTLFRFRIRIEIQKKCLVNLKYIFSPACALRKEFYFSTPDSVSCIFRRQKLSIHKVKALPKLMPTPVGYLAGGDGMGNLRKLTLQPQYHLLLSMKDPRLKVI